MALLLGWDSNHCERKAFRDAHSNTFSHPHLGKNIMGSTPQHGSALAGKNTMGINTLAWLSSHYVVEVLGDLSSIAYYIPGQFELNQSELCQNRFLSNNEDTLLRVRSLPCQINTWSSAQLPGESEHALCVRVRTVQPSEATLVHLHLSLCLSSYHRPLAAYSRCTAKRCFWGAGGTRQSLSGFYFLLGTLSILASWW